MAPAEKNDLDQLAYLTERLNYLTLRIDSMANRVAALEQGKVAREALKSSENQPAIAVSAQPEKVLEMVGNRALLPRAASVSFMLVFALILRTVTDNGIINLQLGSIIGVIYAAGLIGWGWQMYAQKNPLAPVFPVCGSLLLLSIIFETHSRFESLPTFLAISVLVVMACCLGALGIKYRQGFLVFLATLGPSLTAIALGFPNVHFPAVAGLLIVVTIIPIIAHRIGMSGVPRWYIMAVSLLFWSLWSLKLGAPLSRGEQPSDVLATPWFFPLLAFFVLMHFFGTIHRVISLKHALGFYHGIMPTVSSLAFYAIGINVAAAHNAAATFSSVAAVVAFSHFVVAALLARREKKGAPGCNTMAFAGACLLCLSLPYAVGLQSALPVISFAAYGLALFSSRWHSGGVRFTSYLLQGFAALVVLYSLKASPEEVLAGGISALSLAVMAVLQYQWCRSHTPDTQDSAYFAWLDRRDVGAVILLLAGLIGSFALFRLGLYTVLADTSPSWQNTFSCGQTIIINLGATILLLIAARSKSYEILYVCGAVGFFGAIKVFVFDLLNCNGIPLVISVFSFGIVSLAASYVLKKWNSSSVNTASHPISGTVPSTCPMAMNHTEE